MKRATTALLILLTMLSLFACDGGKEKPLDPIETQGIPYEKKPKESTTEGDYALDIYSTYAVITGYTGGGDEAVLPSEIGGTPVLAVGDYAFAYNKELRSVIIPEGIREIGKGAFDECSALEKVTLPGALENIEDYAFRMTAIKEIEFPDSLARIGTYAFYLTRLGSVTIPDGVEKIDRYAFYGIKELKSVTLGKRVTGLGERAFGSCTALEKVSGAEKVKRIGEYCFNGCTALESITAGELEALGEGAFFSCPKLTVMTDSEKTAEMLKKAGTKYEIVTIEKNED